MAYPELTDKQRNYPYSGNVQNPLVVPETRGTVLPTGATPEQTAQGKQNWQSNAPQQYANNPVGTVQYNIFKAMEQQKAQPVTQPQGNGADVSSVKDAVKAARDAGQTVWGDNGTGMLGEYRKWKQAYNGGANNPQGALDYLNSLYTDPQQEEKLRKASVANQRIMAVGDALRHIGNIFNTVNYAPSQQFNKPWEEERNRYLQEKAYRDKRNQIYMTYQQQKAAQDAKIAQAERQFQYNAALNAAKMQQQQNQWDAQNKERTRQFDATLGYKRENDEANRKQRQAQYDKQNKFTQQRIGLGWANHNLSKQKFDYLKSKGTGGSGGGSSYDYATPNGNITMPKNFTQTQKDQVIAKFDRYIDRSEMERQMRKLGLNTQDPAQVRNFQFAKMLQEHQDVADYVSEKFKGKQTFTNTPMSRPEEKTPQPMFQTPWGGAAFAGENPYDEYLLEPESDSGNEDSIDYEQFLIQ